MGSAMDPVIVMVGKEREAVIASILQPMNGHIVSREVLQHCRRGTVIWTLEQQRMMRTGASRIFIGEYTLHRRNGNWGYSVRTEQTGPLHASVPLSYLAAAPATNKRWRDRVVHGMQTAEDVAVAA